jgi:hypothetical protein
MSKQPKVTFSDLAVLPDFALLSRAQLAAIQNCSEDTVDREDASGRGPPRIRIGQRRWGYPVGGVKRYLAEKLAVQAKLSLGDALKMIAGAEARASSDAA